jgi:hypothetical protein
MAWSWLVSSGVGTTDRSLTEFRYGGRHGADFAYRFWGKISVREPGFHATDSNFDDTETARAGFRSDWQHAPSGTFMLDADYYGVQAGQRARITTLTPPYITTVEKDATLSGGHTSWAAGKERGARLLSSPCNLITITPAAGN